ADHVEVDDRARGLKRAQRMRRHVEGAEQAALLGGKHHEEKRPFWFFAMRGIGGERLCQRNHTNSTGAVVVRAVPDLVATDAIMIVVPGENDRLRLELRVAALQQSGNIVGFAGAHGNVDRKSTRLNSSHVAISYAVFCLK